MINIFFSPIDNKKILQSKKTENLLVSFNFHSKNETEILDKLYSLPNYKKLFYIPYTYNYTSYTTTYLHDNENDNYCLNEGQIIGNNVKNILFKLENQQLIYFESYLKTSRQPIITKLIAGFETILSSINELDNFNIIHGSINLDNIIYNTQFGHILLTNFRKSFILSSKENLEKQIIEINYDNHYLPIEYHILCFIITNKWKSLSTYNIEYIIQQYTKNSILHKFNKNILDEFVSSSLKYFQKYVNKTTDEVLSDIYKYSFTWNNYGLCFTFLNILIDLHYNSSNKFIIFFMKLLVNNLHFQPDKRVSSKILLQYFYSFLDNFSKNDYIDCLHLSFSSITSS